jgi:hypothetical protein
MRDADRFRLLGKYRTPRVRVGRFVRCLIRGEIEVVGFTDAPIPWPLGRTSRRPAIIVYAGLARAIRRESAQAVGYWWGVGMDRVWKWRKALGVGATTEGTSRLRSAYCAEPWFEAARAKSAAKSGGPARREKIAAARRGKLRPRHVIEAMAAGRRGKPHDAETRRKMSEAHKRRGTWPPHAAGRGRPQRTRPPARCRRRRPPGGRGGRWRRSRAGGQCCGLPEDESGRGGSAPRGRPCGGCSGS